MCTQVCVFRNKRFALLVPSHGGQAVSFGESGTVVPLLRSAASDPLRPSHTGRRQCFTQSLFQDRQFGGCSRPHRKMEHRGQGVPDPRNGTHRWRTHRFVLPFLGHVPTPGALPQPCGGPIPGCGNAFPRGRGQAPSPQPQGRSIPDCDCSQRGGGQLVGRLSWISPATDTPSICTQAFRPFSGVH